MHEYLTPVTPYNEIINLFTQLLKQLDQSATMAYLRLLKNLLSKRKAGQLVSGGSIATINLLRGSLWAPVTQRTSFVFSHVQRCSRFAEQVQRFPEPDAVDTLLLRYILLLWVCFDSLEKKDWPLLWRKQTAERYLDNSFRW